MRDVPEQVHSVLVQRAKRQGRSLQQYLCSELTQMASRPTVEEVFDRIEARGLNRRVSLEDSAASIRADREHRYGRS